MNIKCKAALEKRRIKKKIAIIGLVEVITANPDIIETKVNHTNVP